MSPLIKGFFAYPPSCHAGHEGVKELRRIEQTLAGCLKNLRFVDMWMSRDRQQYL
jgi:hypothetical protein